MQMQTGERLDQPKDRQTNNQELPLCFPINQILSDLVGHFFFPPFLARFRNECPTTTSLREPIKNPFGVPLNLPANRENLRRWRLVLLLHALHCRPLVGGGLLLELAQRVRRQPRSRIFGNLEAIGNSRF